MIRGTRTLWTFAACVVALCFFVVGALLRPRADQTPSERAPPKPLEQAAAQPKAPPDSPTPAVEAAPEPERWGSLLDALNGQGARLAAALRGTDALEPSFFLVDVLRLRKRGIEVHNGVVYEMAAMIPRQLFVRPQWTPDELSDDAQRRAAWAMDRIDEIVENWMQADKQDVGPAPGLVDFIRRAAGEAADQDHRRVIDAARIRAMLYLRDGPCGAAAAPALEKIGLEDPDPLVRAAAVITQVWFGWNPNVQAELVRADSRGDARCVEAMLIDLSRCTPTMARQFDPEDDRKASFVSARRATAFRTPLDADIVAFLRTTAEPDLRVAAIRALSPRAYEPVALAALCESAGGGRSEEERLAAIYGLGEATNHPQAESTLMAVLGSPEANLVERVEAAHAIRRFGTSGGTELRATIVLDPSSPEQLRRECAQSLDFSRHRLLKTETLRRLQHLASTTTDRDLAFWLRELKDLR